MSAASCKRKHILSDKIDCNAILNLRGQFEDEQFACIIWKQKVLMSVLHNAYAILSFLLD